MLSILAATGFDLPYVDGHILDGTQEMAFPVALDEWAEISWDRAIPQVSWTENHRIMKLEGVYKATGSNPLLSAGIQIKGYLPGGCLNFD